MAKVELKGIAKVYEGGVREKTSDGGGRAGRGGLNVPGNLPVQPPSGFMFPTAI